MSGDDLTLAPSRAHRRHEEGAHRAVVDPVPRPGRGPEGCSALRRLPLLA